MSVKMILTSPAVPNMSALFCPMCGLEVHRTLPGHNPHDPFLPLEIESACRWHLTQHHAARFWLWKKLGWPWILRGFTP